MPDSSPCVLVVDDEPDIRAVMRCILEDEGFTTVTAGNGQEALDRLQTVRPAVVLLDLQMPVMTGQQTLAALRQMDASIPVVFMSAGFRAQTEAERYGADGYLAKPFAFAEVVAVVSRFCP